MSSPASASWKPTAVQALLCFVFFLAGWGAQMGGLTGIAKAFFAASCLAGGFELARDTFLALRRKSLDIHFLMLTAAAASAALGHWHEAALLLVLFSGSSALEEYANHRTETALASLFRDVPRTARQVLADGSVEEVPIESLQPGMMVSVPPGQQVPVDLRVISGHSECDESSLTGEANPVSKSAGSEAMGGTMNLSGSFTGEVLRPASQSALQQIMDLIRHAQQRKARAQHFTDRFGTTYTLLVLALCLLLFLGWWLMGRLPAFGSSPSGQAGAFHRAITVLIVASPCALVLSVPSAILAAIARGARSGVIFRGGSTIEDLAGITAVALDKTGTLTTGEMTVEEIHVLHGAEEPLRHAAYNLARQSTHPLSRAIAAKLTTDTGREDPQHYTNVPGSGVSGELRGGTWALGKRSWIESMATARVDARESHPKPPVSSEVWVTGPEATGYLTLRDQPRTEAAPLLATLHASGLRTLMLTGDRPEAAQAVRDLTGVQEVHAGLLPGDKTDIIAALQKEGQRVAMVGDGVNDAPALTLANVGVAMGLRGSDAALQQADLVLSRDRLEAFVDAWRLSRNAVAVMRQNIMVALGTAALMVIVSVIREIPLWLGVLTHEGSTAIVVLNSLRLLLPGAIGIRRS
jgi:Cd2+/Zn2+-exporting ATPase